jgi:transketolase
MVPLIAEHQGPVYMRISRAAVGDVFDESYTPQIGKGAVLGPGSDLTIVATGSMVARCAAAAEALAAQGIDARLIALSTIKPVDQDLLLQAARETGAIVTAEEHSIVGGLAGAVAEALVRGCPAPIEPVGLNDTFAETGPDPETLMDAWGLSVEDVIAAARRVLERKAARS